MHIYQPAYPVVFTYDDEDAQESRVDQDIDRKWRAYQQQVSMCMLYVCVYGYVHVHGMRCDEMGWDGMGWDVTECAIARVPVPPTSC